MITAHQNQASDPIDPSTSDLTGPAPAFSNAGAISLPTQPPGSIKLQGSTPAFYSLAHPEFPPLPFNPFPDLAVFWRGEGLFLYDDRDVDYVRLRAEAQETSCSAVKTERPISTAVAESVLLGSQTEGEGTLAIKKTAGGLELTISGLQPGTQYALLSKKDLWQQHWEAECVFNPSPEGQWTRGSFQAKLPQKFYQVQRPTLPIVSVECYRDTIIGSGYGGVFLVRRSNCDANSQMVVHWTVSGNATPGNCSASGDDYIALENSVTIEAGSTSAEVYVQPCTGAQVGDSYETVIVTLEPDSNYWINARYSAATNKICRNLFAQVLVRDRGPIGIDYYPVTGDEGLLISDNWWYSGSPCNFTKISKVNGQIVLSPWSSISGLSDEIKVATVKEHVANFQQGDMFFGYKPATGWTTIGRVCADGSPVELDWAVLPGETSPVHGGLHLDRTGLFGNDLIVVTGGEVDLEGEGGRVWRITSNADHSSGTKTVFADITQTYGPTHLEGVLTLPNDPVKYGPWAGKIITGDESRVPAPVIYTIGQGGNVNYFIVEIEDPGQYLSPEDFDIIAQGQSLYCNDAWDRRIWQVPEWYFAEHAGDILVTQAGEYYGTAMLVILHWDAEEERFVPKAIYPPFRNFEHVTFAPIDLLLLN
ncbi:MAG: hypothetical protein GX456_18685 [Verrucomicrobia bacterium]|nr:hypothetical protein [Verrucomicrobiota bacterium]